MQLTCEDQLLTGEGLLEIKFWMNLQMAWILVHDTMTPEIANMIAMTQRIVR
jgi:hypothetical protein